jgi:hypothetical protein
LREIRRELRFARLLFMEDGIWLAPDEEAVRLIYCVNLIIGDPNEWVKQYLVPALEKAGIKDKDEQLREIGILFQSQRAAQLVDLLATQQPRIEKDTALLANAKGLSAADQAIREDPGLAWEGLKNSVDSLVGTTGEGIKAAGLLTQAAQDLSQFTAGLNKEMQAQAKGAPSPASEETNRHLNRLVFGEDTNEGALDTQKILTRQALRLERIPPGDVKLPNRFLLLGER